jgi:tetratricopeptide (TPR) repeat protein
MMRVHKTFCAAALFAAASGGSQKGAETPKLPAAKPEAVEALKDAARSVRLGPANYERALERLKTAEQLDPNLWEAWYDEGWIQLKLRNAEAAVPALEKALSIVPAHAPTVVALGQALKESGRASDAAHVYEKWLASSGAKDPAQAESIRVALGGALRRAGKLDEAADALQKALRTASKATIPAALNELALVYKAKSQLELADLVLHRALEIDDKSKAAALTWNNLGLVALQRRRDQEAFANFDQAAKLDPTLTVARRNKAMVYLDCGDYARAADELKHVTKSDADDLEAWVALGVAERGRNNLDAAQRAFDHALEIDPDDADALFDVAVLQMDWKKEPNKARATLDKYLKAAPSQHTKRKDAEARMKDLAGSAKPPANGVQSSGGT